jgi:hypothetical protein
VTLSVTDVSGNVNSCISIVSVSLDSSLCGVPQNIVVVEEQATHVTINWPPVLAAVGYKLYYRKVGVLPWSEVTTTDTAITVTGLDADSPYECHLQTACVCDINSDWSANFFMTTTPCDVAENIQVNGITDHQATISWNAVINGINYKIG